MRVISECYNQYFALFNKAVATNEVWQFIISLAILIVGFSTLEILWRFALEKTKGILKKKGIKHWLPYLLGFLPSFRVAIAALLIRVAELPLTLPPRILALLHGIENFLFVLALLLFIFQLVRLLDLMVFALPLRKRKKFSDTTLKNLKSTLRIMGILLVAVMFIYTQKNLFPLWLVKSAWWRYFMLLLLFIVLFVGGKLLTSFLESVTDSLAVQAEKTRVRLVLRAALWPMRLLILAIAVYAFQEIIALPKETDRIAEAVVSVLGTLVIIFFLYQLLDVVEYELTKFVSRDDNEFDMNFVQMVRVVAKVLIVIFGVIYLLKAATGKPMTTLLAGLGIGGLAVALAAQDTLKNLFGSFVVMIDKPFIVGDWVYVEGSHATVEEIGLRSTRIRSFSGHVITIPNEKMATMSIENVQRRPYIRRLMNITVTYDTPVDKVEKAVSLIKDILKDRTELHPDYQPKVHFNEFNDASLNILVVYWFERTDYWASVAFNEEINFAIMRAFEAEGIEFAFPTTTTYLAHDDRRPLHIALSSDAGSRNEGESE